MKNFRGAFPIAVYILLLSAPLLFSASAQAGLSGTDTVLAQRIRTDAIEPVLFSHMVCLDKNDCDRRAVIRFSVAGHIGWRIYGMTDSVAINEVFSKLLALAKTLPQQKTYALYIYRESESEVGFFSKPTAQLIIQGEQK